MIAALLTAYLTAFPSEEERLKRLRRLVAETPQEADLLSRENPFGHITASGFVVSQATGRMLRVYHRGLKAYFQPGGHCEAGDASLIDSALREVQEETGLTAVEYLPYHSERLVPLDIDVHAIPANPAKGEAAHWHHDFRYLFLFHGDESDIEIAPDEVTAYRWDDLDDLRPIPSFDVAVAKIQRRLRESTIRKNDDYVQHPARISRPRDEKDCRRS